MINPSITSALLAVSRQEDVAKKIEGKLKKAGANSPASAISLGLKDKDQALLDQALAAGTVKETTDGRHYLDELAIADRNEGKGFMTLLILLVTGSLIASVIVLMERAGGH